MVHKEGDLYTGRDGRWHYWLNGRTSSLTYGTKPEAARAYVSAYLNVNPKYKPLFEGKTWRQIFDMLQMQVA